MSTDQIDTVYVPGEGLAVAHLHQPDPRSEDWQLAYTINKVEWQAHWKYIDLPKVVNARNKPQSVSLAVDSENNLIATVKYGYGRIITTRLGVNPNWQTLTAPKRKV